MNDAEKDNYPDLYFDGVQTTVTIFGVNMTLTLGAPHPQNEVEARDVKKVATIRTSLEHAKIFAMLLRNQIKNYEINSNIEIKVPPQVYEGLKINSNDW